VARHVNGVAKLAHSHAHDRGTGLAIRTGRGGHPVIDRNCSGTRCRIVRQLPHPGGAIERHSLGTIRYGLENLGRHLVLVDWDTGKATMVFPEDIEIYAEAATA
jgi:hypothetical protein